MHARLRAFAIYRVEHDASGPHRYYIGEQEGFDAIDAKQTWWHRHQASGISLAALAAVELAPEPAA